MVNIEMCLNDMLYYPEVKSDKYFNQKGVSVPRVTEILSTMIHSDNLMYWANSLGLKGVHYGTYMKKVADVGTLTHSHIEEFLKKKTQAENDIPFQGFMMWYDHLISTGHTIELVGSEQKIACEWFGGTYDALIRIDGKLYLVDFKTSNHVTEKYFLQLSAYGYMLEGIGYHVDGYIVLQLNKDEPGFNEYILLMDILEHKAFMDNCVTCFLSLTYAYYNVFHIRDQYKTIF